VRHGEVDVPEAPLADAYPRGPVAFDGRARREDEGATAVEYGIMLALIAAVIIAAVAALGTTLNSAYCSPMSEAAAAGVTTPAGGFGDPANC
jgi:pilus assembly protein Flp/PilA